MLLLPPGQVRWLLALHPRVIHMRAGLRGGRGDMYEYIYTCTLATPAGDVAMQRLWEHVSALELSASAKLQVESLELSTSATNLQVQSNI